MKTKFVSGTLIISFLSLLLLATTPVFAEDDDHYINSDHYFIAQEKLTTGWIRVNLATLKTAATAQSKNEAEFITVKNGEELWTKFYYKTRIAAKEELKIGLEVIGFDVADNDLYRAPENKDEALQSDWFMAKITDVSDMYKGFVTVSGGYKIKIDNIRVVDKKK